MMDARRWHRIEAIFHAAAELPPGDGRRDRISALCGGDAALAREVLGLLAEDDRLQSNGPVADPRGVET